MADWLSGRMHDRVGSHPLSPTAPPCVPRFHTANAQAVIRSLQKSTTTSSAEICLLLRVVLMAPFPALNTMVNFRRWLSQPERGVAICWSVCLVVLLGPNQSTGIILLWMNKYEKNLSSSPFRWHNSRLVQAAPSGHSNTDASDTTVCVRWQRLSCTATQTRSIDFNSSLQSSPCPNRAQKKYDMMPAIPSDPEKQLGWFYRTAMDYSSFNISAKLKANGLSFLLFSATCAGEEQTRPKINCFPATC